MSAGRAAGAVTLLLIWTVLAAVLGPIVREARQDRRSRRRRLFEQLTPAQSWQGQVSPAVRVLPPRTAAAGDNPRPVAAPGVPPQRRVS